MAGQGSSKQDLMKDLASYYLASGFAEDCYNLFKQFEKANDINFNTFCKLWKDMEMSMIYLGRPSSAELFELCEEVLIVAKGIFFVNVDFKKQVFGVYLLYALYYTQPYRKIVIKFTSSEAELLNVLMQKLKAERLHDTLYILCNLLCQGAIQIYLSERDHAAEKTFRSFYEGLFSNHNKSFKPDSTLKDILGDNCPTQSSEVSGETAKSCPENVAFNENIGIYALDKNLQTYHKMKCKLQGVNASKPTQELDVIDHKIASRMALLLKKMCNISSTDPTDDPDNSVRRQIKRKAFENEVFNMYDSRKSSNSRNKLDTLLTDAPEGDEEKMARVSRSRLKKSISLFDAEESDTD